MDTTTLQAYLNLAVLKTLREGFKEGDGEEGEGKFGLVPPSRDPNSVLSQVAQQTAGHQPSLRMHPLLSKSAQFSGVDPNLTGDPVSYEKAQDKYPQLRLQRQLRSQPTLRRSPPRLTR